MHTHMSRSVTLASKPAALDVLRPVTGGGDDGAGSEGGTEGERTESGV